MGKHGVGSHTTLREPGVAGVSGNTSQFEPLAEIVEGNADRRCRACITVPARNEAASLARCLDALAAQTDLYGSVLPSECYEILLLLNNCTDESAQIARAWQLDHPHTRVHIVDCMLAKDEAHVGTARRLLMDTAWSRLVQAVDQGSPCAILSTDADSVVATDWLAQNMRALQEGADVVGGRVNLLQQDLESLPQSVRRCYESDREYAQLIAELEDLLDPQLGDPWPRHLDHFGSSLAMTPQAYAVAGGMPAVSPLEDEAFIDKARQASLVIRHDPKVNIYTSARSIGRAAVGLAGQFRLWNELADGNAHLVRSAAFVEHRFRSLRRLREIFETKALTGLSLPTEWWVNTFQQALANEATYPAFLGAVYCDILIEESFGGESQDRIGCALQGLRERITDARRTSARHADSITKQRTDSTALQHANTSLSVAQ